MTARARIHRRIFISLLILLVIAMTTSVFVSNMMWVFLLANWVAEWNWKEKFADFRHNYLLQAFLVLTAVYLTWLLGSQDGCFSALQTQLPLFVLPLVLLTSAPLNRRELSLVAAHYVAAIIVVSLIGLVRYLTIPDLPYRKIVPYISHIRFALNICMALVIIAYVVLKQRRRWMYCVGGAIACWLLVFLLMIRSYTGLIILAVTSVLLLVVFGKRVPRMPRIVASGTIGLLLILGSGLTAYYCYSYYHLCPLSAQPLAVHTANGNEYSHSASQFIENGNYLRRYICSAEMRQEWNKVSSIRYDSTDRAGYPVSETLTRYLNAIGTTKDSAGIARLTSQDIANIEQGVANPVYLQHGPRKMVYVMCFEYESHKEGYSAKNFTMLQRYELWQNGWAIFKEHPLLGVGTGDVFSECLDRLTQNHSSLIEVPVWQTHNQYLNFLVAFGLLGFLIILGAFVRGVWLSRSCRSALFTAFLCIALISFTTEDTLETLMGILFVALGYCLLGNTYKGAPTPLPHKQTTSLNE